MAACQSTGTRPTPNRCANLLACSCKASERRQLCWPSVSAEDGTVHCNSGFECLAMSVIDQFGDGDELHGAAKQSA